MIALPLVLSTFYLSLSGRFAAHRRLARWTFPIWLYVSVTGVVVFVMLQIWIRAGGLRPLSARSRAARLLSAAWPGRGRS
jgi:hypothetical protein